MTAWSHRYSEPLLWLACAALVVVLTCVPRCARAQEIDNVTTDGTYIYWSARPDGRIRRATLEELSPGFVGAMTSTSVTTGTDFEWVVPADHRHEVVFQYGQGGGGWIAPEPAPVPSCPWWVTALVGGGTSVLVTFGWNRFVGLVQRRLGQPLRTWRCRLCGETASGTDVADATVAHVLAGACNGDMEDEPLPVQAIGGLSMEEAAQNLRRLQS